MNDFRFALRQLAKSPGFTGIAILTLALGIGLNTSMFGLLNLLVLRPLPFPERDQLVRIYRTTPQSQTAPHYYRRFPRPCARGLLVRRSRGFSFLELRARGRGAPRGQPQRLSRLPQSLSHARRATRARPLLHRRRGSAGQSRHGSRLRHLAGSVRRRPRGRRPHRDARQRVHDHHWGRARLDWSGLYLGAG